METSVFRLYGPSECGPDHYPFAWHDLGDGRGVKHLVREAAGHRCIRCLHPYAQGAGRNAPCDDQCKHSGPGNDRILTVHHLQHGNDAKRDLRWWNLTALCQRCHLQIQGKVDLLRVWPWPHSDWFRPYAAGWYAFAYLGEELTREQTLERMDELLALEALSA